jgi:hypothetical protein
MIFLLLASLVAIYQRLGIGKKSPVAIQERIAIHLPFSVYLGWITVATIADVAAALDSLRWNGFGVGPDLWASSAILVALLITALVIVTRKDVAYSLVIIWALVGIAESHAENSTIMMLTLAGAMIIAIMIAGTMLVSSQRLFYRQRAEQIPNN